MKRTYQILSVVAALLLMRPAVAQESFTIAELRTEWGNEAIGLQSRPQKPGIADFVLAFAYGHQGMVLTDETIRQMTRENYVNEDVAEFTLDRRAGYMALRMVSDGTQEMEMCYWNLPAGTKRVAVMLQDVYDPDPDPFLRFYDYDADRNELVALNPPPVDIQLDHTLCHFHLPRTGKDIRILCHYTEDPAWYRYAGAEGFRYDGPDYLEPGPAEPALGCYLISGKSKMNLRYAPGGEVAVQVPPDIYVLSVAEPTDGWWRITGRMIWAVEGRNFFLPSGPYWISATLLGLGLRNYGGEPVDLRTEPRDDAPVAGTVTEEAAEVTPLDVTKDFEWVKVRWGQVSGWVRSEMLCDNPVTNCC